MLLEPVQVLCGDIGRKVIGGWLNGVETHVRGQVDELEEIHLGGLGGQVIPVGIGCDAQLEMTGPSAADWRDRAGGSFLASRSCSGAERAPGSVCFRDRR